MGVLLTSGVSFGSLGHGTVKKDLAKQNRLTEEKILQRDGGGCRATITYKLETGGKTYTYKASAYRATCEEAIAAATEDLMNMI